MKIISWNINGYRSVTGQNPSKRYDVISNDNKLFAYIENEKPDIICLQETKAEPEQIDDDKKAPDGYHAFYSSCKIKKGYSGVVTFSKQKPVNEYYGIGIPEFDDEGRICGLDFGEFLLFNIYFPNGTSGQHRVDYKLKFYDALFDFLEPFKAGGKKIIVTGDYNTAHKEIDLARPKDNETNSGFLPEERAKVDDVLALGYTDIFRKFNSQPGQYTWWTTRGQARKNNIGWRIDYFLVSENLKELIKGCSIQPDIMGSDHCPIVLEF